MLSQPPEHPGPINHDRPIFLNHIAACSKRFPSVTAIVTHWSKRQSLPSKDPGIGIDICDGQGYGSDQIAPRRPISSHGQHDAQPEHGRIKTCPTLSSSMANKQSGSSVPMGRRLLRLRTCMDRLSEEPVTLERGRACTKVPPKCHSPS